jgi:DNA-binding response OmpR family regulator
VSGSGTTGPALVEALAARGLRTASAAGAEEAVRRSRHVAPSAIVLDVLAPGEAAGHPGVLLRRAPETRQTPLYLAAPPTGNGVARSGAEAILARPVDPSEMVTALQRLLGRRAPRILVVDRQDRPRRVLAAHLEHCGMVPIPAATAEDVRSLGRGERPDAVVLDARQPEEILRAVRTSRELADRPVLLLAPADLDGCPLLEGATPQAMASDLVRRLDSRRAAAARR